MRIGALSGAVLVAALAVTTLPAGASAQDAAPLADDATTAAANEEQARAHFRLGRAHYDNGNFAQAAVEFEEAYRISQRSALLYNIYLAYRDANDTRNAAVALRKYLELEKEVENRGQLEARLAALERSLADGTAPQPAVVAPVEQAPAEQTPAEQTPTEAAPAAATSDAPAAEQETNLVPWILMGGGGAMIVGGLVVGAMASGKQSELDDLCPDGNCGAPDPAKQKKVEDLQSSGESLALVADILLFGGIAVAGTGAVLFILDQTGGDAGESDAGPTASVACGPGLCGATFRTAF